jgi:hypothetical protein
MKLNNSIWMGVIGSLIMQVINNSQAGTLTFTSPTYQTSGTTKYFIAKKDTAVTFTCVATTTTGNVTSDGYKWNFSNGSVAPGTTTNHAGPILVTFGASAEGQASVCTVGLTHIGSENGESCTSNDKVISSITICVPRVEFNKENNSPEAKNYIENNTNVSSGKIEISSMVKIKIDKGDGTGGVVINGLTSSRSTSDDSFNPTSGSTKTSGYFETVLKTKNKDSTLKVKFTHEGLEHESEEHVMLPAIYRTQFAITGYYTPNEINFSGNKVTNTMKTTGSSLNPGTYKRYIITSSVAAREGFLQAIAIEGEGYLENEQHVHVNNVTRVGTSNPILIDSTVVPDNDTPQGKWGALVNNDSCAIVKLPFQN